MITRIGFVVFSSLGLRADVLWWPFLESHADIVFRFSVELE
jgi:hypothetical protein